MRENPKLDDACSITTGKLDSNQVVVGGQYPFFTCAPEPLTIDSYAFDDSVILIAGNNASGTFHINRYAGKFNAYQRTYVLTAKPGYDLDYVFYSLKLELRRLKEKSQGSQTKFLTMPILKDIDVTRQDLPSQKKIAAVLVALDSKIDLNNRINAKLEAMAKTLYDYWFVQFDFPDNNRQPYKSSGGKMHWNDEVKREIPDAWDVFKLGDVFETSLGGTPATNDEAYWKNGTISWLNSGEIANFPVVESELKITEAAIRSSATELLPKGTTLLSITRHLRPTVLAIDACANQSVVAIKENDDIKYYFIYPYLQNEIPRLLTLRTGAQQPHINKDTVDASLVVLPDKDADTLKLYNSKVGCVYEQIINNAFQNQRLAELRDWLLPMLMNGQVTINEPAKLSP
jgi:type I restriction enzyme S subunit